MHCIRTHAHNERRQAKMSIIKRLIIHEPVGYMYARSAPLYVLLSFEPYVNCNIRFYH